MKIAVPVSGQQIAEHFGQCREFHIFSADPETKEIMEELSAAAPPHEPGILPSWLADHGVDTVIASGMGKRAQQLFSEYRITVVTGAVSSEPRQAVDEYLKHQLKTGSNQCTH